MEQEIKTGLKIEHEAVNYLLRTEDFKEEIAAFTQKNEATVERILIMMQITPEMKNS